MSEFDLGAALTQRLEQGRRGRGPRLTQEQRDALVTEFATSEPPISAAALARKYGVSPQSAWYLIRSRAKRLAESK